MVERHRLEGVMSPSMHFHRRLHAHLLGRKLKSNNEVFREIGHVISKDDTSYLPYEYFRRDRMLEVLRTGIAKQRIERCIAAWKMSVITSNDPKDMVYTSAEKVAPEIERRACRSWWRV